MAQSLPLDLSLSEVSGVPFYRQIREQIAGWIRTGHLPAEAPLPSVRELAATLRVSVITTRRAYRDLEADGLVVARQGRGTFVAEHPRPAARRQATEQARELLREATARARRLGLDDDELRSLMGELLEDER